MQEYLKQPRDNPEISKPQSQVGSLSYLDWYHCPLKKTKQNATSPSDLLSYWSTRRILPDLTSGCMAGKWSQTLTLSGWNSWFSMLTHYLDVYCESLVSQKSI